MKKVVIFVAVMFGLCSCDKHDPILPGERHSIFATEKINVLICGGTGTGKTFLTQCVASKLMEQNKVVLFTTAFNLTLLLIYAFNECSFSIVMIAPTLLELR